MHCSVCLCLEEGLWKGVWMESMELKKVGRLFSVAECGGSKKFSTVFIVKHKENFVF